MVKSRGFQLIKHPDTCLGRDTAECEGILSHHGIGMHAKNIPELLARMTVRTAAGKRGGVDVCCMRRALDVSFNSTYHCQILDCPNLDVWIWIPC